jgi:hypothetical protein
MSQLDALQAAVCAAPEDMAPRRAYAAAVKAGDPDRAKLIELQLALRDARRAGTDPDATAARDLVKKRGAAWAGPLAREVDYFMFWGGFVEEIEANAGKLLASATAWQKQAPLRHLRVRALAGKVADLAKLPLLAQIRSLDVQGCRLRDVDIAELVASPRLRALRLLRIGNNPDVTLDGLRMIARASLPELRFVDATGTGAPLVKRTSDWDGSIPEVTFTKAQGTLVDEFGKLRWLVAEDEPSPDAI